MFLDQEKTGQEFRNLENECHLPTRTRQVSQQCNNVHTISCVYVQSESAAEHFPPLNMLRIVNFKIILQLHHPLRSFRVLLPFSLRQKAENQQSELCYQDKLQGIMQYFSQLGGGEVQALASNAISNVFRLLLCVCFHQNVLHVCTLLNHDNMSKFQEGKLWLGGGGIPSSPSPPLYGSLELVLYHWSCATEEGKDFLLSSLTRNFSYSHAVMKNTL